MMSGLRKTVRHAVWKCFWPMKYVSCGWRGLPEFIIIGAQKGGTTSLHYYLSQHPQLVAASKKEVHFFNGGLDPRQDSYEKGLCWYRAHFPLSLRKKGGVKFFEATPAYLYHREVPRRIHEFSSQIKLLAVLRNPVDRAVSHYFHEVRNGHETLGLVDALEAEDKRLHSAMDECEKKYNLIHYSYKARGVYWKQVEAYYKLFDQSQICILDSAQLFSDAPGTVKSIFNFLGVESEGIPIKAKPKNVAPKRPEVDPEVYEYLRDYYSEHNEKLYSLIGRDFGW